MHQAPRCSKRSGKPCKSPAVKGHRVCRMHGAGGGAPRGNRNAWKHGLYSAESLALNRLVRDLARSARELFGSILNRPAQAA
jgi:glucans biosynthesis protein